MTHKEMYNLIGDIEKFIEETEQTMRNETKFSPKYYSANGEACAYIKVINHIYELINEE